MDGVYSTDGGDQGLLIEDWLGWAAYLAEAVGSDATTAEAARSELRAAAPDHTEREMLRQAIGVAADRFGDDALATSLLRSAAVAAEGAAEAA